MMALLLLSQVRKERWTGMAGKAFSVWRLPDITGRRDVYHDSRLSMVNQKAS